MNDHINSSFITEQPMNEGVQRKTNLLDNQNFLEEQAESIKDWREVDIQFEVHCRDKAHANDPNFYAH